jgi:hypothetical protein
MPLNTHLKIWFEMQAIKDLDLSNVDISKVTKVEDFINVDTVKILKEIEHSGILSIPEDVMIALSSKEQIEVFKELKQRGQLLAYE